MDKKLIILSAVIAVIVIGWVFVYYMPASQELSVLNVDLADLREKENKKISQSEVNVIQSSVGKLISDIEEKMIRVYSGPLLLDLGRNVEKIAKDYDMDLIQIEVNYESLILFRSVEEISDLPVKMEFKGTFSNFSKLLDDVTNLPFAMRLQKIEIEKDQPETDYLKIVVQGIIVIKNEKNGEVTKAKETEKVVI